MRWIEGRRVSAVLRQYGLATPLGEDVQRRIARDYSAIYTKIAASSARAGILAGVIAALYFLVKKAALPVPLVKATAVLTLIVSIGAGIYFVSSSSGAGPVYAEPVVVVRPLSSRTFGAEAGVSLARQLGSALDRRFGAGFSLLASGPEILSAPWALFGTVETIDGSIVIIVKIVDSESSRVKAIAEERCPSLNEAGPALERIAEMFPYPGRD
jgi:hypothetical protein